MSYPESSNETDVWLARVADHLKQNRYGTHTPDYLAKVKYFLSYLLSENLTVHNVQPSDVRKYLDTLRPKRKSGRNTLPSKGLRIPHRAAINMLMRLVHGHWPLAPVAKSKQARCREKLIGGYDAWMRDLRGLAERTRSIRCAEARSFLEWLGERRSQMKLTSFTVVDLDAYVRSRASSMRRRSLQSLTGNLRIFLRYLHGLGMIPDLGSTLIGPRVYAFEGMPSALRAEEIDKVLYCTRQDHKPSACATTQCCFYCRPTDCARGRSLDCVWRTSIGHMIDCEYAISKQAHTRSYHCFERRARHSLNTCVGVVRRRASVRSLCMSRHRIEPSMAACCTRRCGGASERPA